MPFSTASPGLGSNDLARLISGNGSIVATTTAGSTRQVYSSSDRALSSLGLPVSAGDVLFEVRKDGTETRLVAARELRPGEVLFDHTTGVVSNERCRHNIQIREGQHMLADDELLLMDHSCAPNSELEVVNPSSVGQEPYLRATVRASTVQKGDALTLDYNAFQVGISFPFDCVCGAANCRGRVSGFADLPRAVQDEYIDGRWSDSSKGSDELPPPHPLTEAVKLWAMANIKSG